MDRDDLDSALACVPPSVVQRIGEVKVETAGQLDDEELASRWTQSADGLRVELATGETSDHDLAIEMLTCVGQAVWEETTDEERSAWFELLQGEIADGVTGEIDEAALEARLALMAEPGDLDALEAYAAAAFAGSLAEYIHNLWHDVEFNEGEEFLPEAQVKARFALLSRWFPGFPPANG